MTSFISEVKNLTGIDFSNYSISSLTRRIERLMIIWHKNTIETFIQHAKDNANLLEMLVNEITVNTTEMFRDTNVWIELKEHLKNFSISNFLGLRIWHAACSRGDEVFSMLILLNELGLLKNAKLTATDLNTKMIENAMSGKLHVIRAEHSIANLKKVLPEASFDYYFPERDEYFYYFNSDLLKHVTFKPFNLITDNQPGVFDIVLCRNVLIYFNLDLQNEVLLKLLYSLKLNGHLVLGSKESVAWSKTSSKFETISIANRIYKKVAPNPTI